MKTDHRPWPVPDEPWIMRQVWHDLLFAHWPLKVVSVPQGLTLDTFNGTAWVGVVPFRMTGVRPRGMPATPWTSKFPEINVRTYVTVDGKPGVYFFSLDVPNRAIVMAARRWYRLPYFRARMSSETIGDGVQYTHRRTHLGAPPASFSARYHPIGEEVRTKSGTLEHWLTERYCLYTMDRGSRLYRAEINHAPWPLQPARAEIETNTMFAGLHGPPVVHFARRLEVQVWPLRRL